MGVVYVWVWVNPLVTSLALSFVISSSSLVSQSKHLFDPTGSRPSGTVSTVKKVARCRGLQILTAWPVPNAVGTRTVLPQLLYGVGVLLHWDFSQSGTGNLTRAPSL